MRSTVATARLRIAIVTEIVPAVATGAETAGRSLIDGRSTRRAPLRRAQSPDPLDAPAPAAESRECPRRSHTRRVPHTAGRARDTRGSCYFRFRDPLEAFLQPW